MEMASWHRPAAGHARVHVSPLSPGGQGKVQSGGSGRATQVCCQSPANESAAESLRAVCFAVEWEMVWCGAGS